MAHKNAPHHLRGDAEELGPVLPVHFMLIDQTQINLVHQGGRLQRVSRAFPVEEADGLPVQLVVDQRKQRFERRASPPLPAISHWVTSFLSGAAFPAVSWLEILWG